MPIQRVLYRDRSLAPGMVSVDAIITDDGTLAVEGKGVSVTQPGGSGNPYVLTISGEGSLNFSSISCGAQSASDRFVSFEYSESARTITLSFYDALGAFQDLAAGDGIHVHARIKNSSGQ